MTLTGTRGWGVIAEKSGLEASWWEIADNVNEFKDPAVIIGIGNQKRLLRSEYSGRAQLLCNGDCRDHPLSGR